MTKSELKEKEFAFIYGSKGIRIHEGMTAEAWSWETTSQTKAWNKEKELEVEQGFKFSKPILSNVLPPARPHILNLYK